VTWAGADTCKRCGASLESTYQSSRASAEGQITRSADRVYTKTAVRRAGLKTIKTGALFTALYVAVIVTAIVVNSGNSGYHISFKLIGFTGLFPVAWFLAGVLQAVTGVPFDELSDRWASLAGWQRGLIGVSVFVAGLLLLLVLLLIILFVLDWQQGIHRSLF